MDTAEPSKTPESSARNNNMNPKLETEAEYKERWNSNKIIYFTMFLISLGFTIIVTGVWPYLDKLDPHAGKTFMGYVVAANPFAQMIFSPIVGYWVNRLNGSIRVPLILTLVLYILASALYASLELFDSHHKWLMLLSRLLVGVSSANVAACRSYLSEATTVSERGRAVAMISLAQVLGFIVGPALQAAVVPLGSEGFWLVPHLVKLNMYTAAGWLSAALSVVNVVLFAPHFFREHRIAHREAMRNQGAKSEGEFTNTRPNYFSAWTLIVAFFVLVFNFMLLETLATPLIMDQFAWTKDTALFNMGILMTIGGVVSILCFWLIGPLSRRFAEIRVLIWGGFFFMLLGRAVYIPWGDAPPPMYDDAKTNATLCDISARLNGTCSGVELVGCPASQKWCEYTPAMTLFQFILGFGLTVVGYPIGVTLNQTIFSKVLGSQPQGVWMGLLTSSGCLSRVLGPVFVTYIYTNYGTNWTFGFTTAMMFVAMVWLLVFADRLAVRQDAATEQGTELLPVPRTNGNIASIDA